MPQSTDLSKVGARHAVQSRLAFAVERRTRSPSCLFFKLHSDMDKPARPSPVHMKASRRELVITVCGRTQTSAARAALERAAPHAETAATNLALALLFADGRVRDVPRAGAVLEQLAQAQSREVRAIAHNWLGHIASEDYRPSGRSAG